MHVLLININWLATASYIIKISHMVIDILNFQGQPSGKFSLYKYIHRENLNKFSVFGPGFSAGWSVSKIFWNDKGQWV